MVSLLASTQIERNIEHIMCCRLPSVLHLSDVERTTSQGIDREELIEWYLEQKEHELTSVEELETEREIVAKALTKLVKDKYLMELRGAVGDSIGDETMEASADDHTQVHYVVRKLDAGSNTAMTCA
jgi:hypothetical protein